MKKLPTNHAQADAPWWKEPMCWVVIGGPASVVVASLATAVIAWKHIDPIIQEDKSGVNNVVLQGPPGSSTGPAVQGRNHAATAGRTTGSAVTQP